MPRPSRAQLAVQAFEQTIIDNLTILLNNPATAATARSKAIGTLRGIHREKSRKLAKSQEATSEKRRARDAKRADADRKAVLASILPDNGRGGAIARPAKVDKRLLPRPGETAAEIRARFEAMAAEG
jgi:hypothetical protein